MGVPGVILRHDQSVTPIWGDTQKPLLQENRMNSKIEVPERVAFVNLKTGNVFFDCHPSEARAAMQSVREMREKGSLETRERQRNLEDLKEYVEAVMASDVKPVHFDILGDEGDLSYGFISERFREIESNDITVDLIIVNAREYAWFRKAGQSSFEQATQKEVIEMGIFGEFWNAKVVVRKKCPPGEVFISGGHSDGTTIYSSRSIVRCVPIAKDANTVLETLNEINKNSSKLSDAIRKMLIPKERRPSWSLGRTAIVTEVDANTVHIDVLDGDGSHQRKENVADFDVCPKVGDTFLIRETFEDVSKIPDKNC